VSEKFIIIINRLAFRLLRLLATRMDPISQHQRYM